MRRFVVLSNFAHADDPRAQTFRYFKGGKYRPLNDTDCDRIIETAFGILEKIGIADTPDWLSHELLAKGAKQRHDGRLLFPRTYVEAVLKRGSSKVDLPGFDENRGITVGSGNVHIGTGGAAVQMLEDGSL